MKQTPLPGPSAREKCGSTRCYVDVKPPNTRVLLFSYDSSTSRPKGDLLLCVARHHAVTLTWDSPLSKAPGPGLSVSAIEPSGFFSPGSACRRVVPWGTVSSWVKGVE